MGYCLYITRAESWLDAKEHPILQDEWMSIVESDPTLSVNTEDHYQRENDDGEIETLHPVEWSGAKDENCFWFADGAIECKNPSERWIEKMLEIATKLNARVLGEEDEPYTNGEFARPKTQSSPKRSWIARLFGRS